MSDEAKMSDRTFIASVIILTYSGNRCTPPFCETAHQLADGADRTDRMHTVKYKLENKLFSQNVISFFPSVPGKGSSSISSDVSSSTDHTPTKAPKNVATSEGKPSGLHYEPKCLLNSHSPFLSALSLSL